MYPYRAKYFLLSSLIIIFCIKASGQTSTISNPVAGRENAPYSIFGVGEEWNGNNTVLRGMANTTAAYENAYEVNSDNPASYSFLALTTYEVGGMASSRTLETANSTYNTGTATLSYLNIGIPLGKNGGMCLGFRPFTRVYYTVADTDNTGTSPLGRTAKSYTGVGGVNYAYVGGAYKFKGLSIGANLGYMFGTISQTSGLIDLDTTLAYNSVFSNYTRIGGLYWKGGIMYETKLKKDITLRIGGTLALMQNIHTTLSSYAVGYYPFSDTTINDTVNSSTANKSGHITLPMSYSFGVHLAGTDKWDVGIDYSASQYSQFRSNGLLDSNSVGTYTNSYKIAIGGEITPNIASRSYWSRVTYRAGLYYGTDFISFNGTALPYYGITLGGSLPFKRSTSHIHGSLDVGRLGSKATVQNGTAIPTNLVQETYVRFTVGISFNDRWFQKRRYE